MGVLVLGRAMDLAKAKVKVVVAMRTATGSDMRPHF